MEDSWSIPYIIIKVWHNKEKAIRQWKAEKTRRWQ